MRNRKMNETACKKVIENKYKNISAIIRLHKGKNKIEIS